MWSPALLQARLAAARQRTDALFERLTPAGLLARPIAERHRFIFYLGHLEVFDWNLLCRDALGQPSRNAAWEQLFAFGIDPLDGDHPDDPPEAWPSAAALWAWGAELRRDVDAALVELPPSGWLQGGWAAQIALEHRLMHAETLAYLLYQLPTELKRVAASPEPAPLPPLPPNAPCLIEAGVASLGLARAEAPWLGWDNEYEAHRVEVPAFQMDRLPATCADVLAFVEAGGYTRRELWDADAWAWLQQGDLRHPRTWRRREAGWTLVAMGGERPLPLRWPAYLSHAEATAYARWRGGRLPTEAEWHRAALTTPEGGSRQHPWGDDAPRAGHHGCFDFISDDPVPVGSHPAGQSAWGVDELVGNGWEWTSTPFAPFAGFEALPFYPGYSADFFDGRHFVMKGASPATAQTFLRPSFRNWFQPRYPYAFAKLRCVYPA